jgi:hypothetical protein
MRSVAQAFLIQPKPVKLCGGPEAGWLAVRPAGVSAQPDRGGPALRPLPLPLPAGNLPGVTCGGSRLFPFPMQIQRLFGQGCREELCYDPCSKRGTRDSNRATNQTKLSWVEESGINPRRCAAARVWKELPQFPLPAQSGGPTTRQRIVTSLKISILGLRLRLHSFSRPTLFHPNPQSCELG